MVAPAKRPTDAPQPPWASLKWRAEWNRHLMADKRLQANHRAIIDYVKTLSHREYGGCWASHAAIADVMGCQSKTVARALGRGVQLGWLTCRHRKQDTNVYAPAMPPHFSDGWVLAETQGRTPASNLEAKQAIHVAGTLVSDLDRTSLSTTPRTPMSDNPEGTDDTRVRTRVRRIDYSAWRTDDPWPAGSWSEREAALLIPFGLEPGALAGAERELRAWRDWEVDWHIARLAVANCLGRQTKPIRSFSYFTAEVHQLVELAARHRPDPYVADLVVGARAMRDAIEKLRERRGLPGEDPPIVPLPKRGRPSARPSEKRAANE